MQITSYNIIQSVPMFQQIPGVAFPACTFSHNSCLSYIKQSGILARCTNGNSSPFLSPKRNVRCQRHFHPEQSQETRKFFRVTRIFKTGSTPWNQKTTNPNPPRACKWHKNFLAAIPLDLNSHQGHQGHQGHPWMAGGGKAPHHEQSISFRLAASVKKGSFLW